MEQAKEAECRDALKDLVNLVTSLTTYGVSELKPAGVTTGAPFLLPGFAVPQPAGKGEFFLSAQSRGGVGLFLLVGPDRYYQCETDCHFP